MTERVPRATRDSTWRWTPLLAIPIAGLLVAVVFPFDGAVTEWARSIRLGGDIRRELETYQQFGQGGSILLVFLLIWTLDPSRRRRLLDYLLALALTFVVVQPMKMLVGRPRPKFGDPGYVCGPFGSYPIDSGAGPELHRAWEIGTGISSDLWSMPSSHTAYAAVMAVFLARLYPRAWWAFGVLLGIVGVARVLTGAHWASDVVMGGGIGLGIAMAAIPGRARRGVTAQAASPGLASGGDVADGDD